MDKLSRSSPPLSRTPIDALTGIRAVAAVWVVVFHFRTELVALLPALSPAMPLAAAGRLGVDLFFILSGFILAYNYADEFRSIRPGLYGRFLWLRLARIYPVHLFTLVMLVVIVTGARTAGLPVNPAEMYSLSTLATNVLMVNAWTGMELSWNYPAWSISAEWFAYLVFPVAGLTLARIRSGWAALAGAGAALAAMYAVFVLFPTAWAFPAPLVRISTEFVAGYLLCVAYRRGVGSTWRWPAIGTLALTSSMVAGTVLEFHHRSAIWAVPGLAIAILALAHADRGGLRRWLASSHMIFLGKISYALYMTHAICQLALAHLVPPAVLETSLLVRTGVVAGYATIVIAAAIAVYYLVEEPSRHWIRRHTPGRAKGERGQPLIGVQPCGCRSSHDHVGRAH
jgi:peptidoglycan/LPS O-acetylase OafA/YrhL